MFRPSSNRIKPGQWEDAAQWQCQQPPRADSWTEEEPRLLWPLSCRERMLIYGPNSPKEMGDQANSFTHWVGTHPLGISKSSVYSSFYSFPQCQIKYWPPEVDAPSLKKCSVLHWQTYSWSEYYRLDDPVPLSNSFSWLYFYGAGDWIRNGSRDTRVKGKTGTKCLSVSVLLQIQCFVKLCFKSLSNKLLKFQWFCDYFRMCFV